MIFNSKAKYSKEQQFRVEPQLRRYPLHLQEAIELLQHDPEATDRLQNFNKDQRLHLQLVFPDKQAFVVPFDEQRLRRIEQKLKPGDSIAELSSVSEKYEVDYSTAEKFVENKTADMVDLVIRNSPTNIVREIIVYLNNLGYLEAWKEIKPISKDEYGGVRIFNFSLKHDNDRETMVNMITPQKGDVYVSIQKTFLSQP